MGIGTVIAGGGAPGVAGQNANVGANASSITDTPLGGGGGGGGAANALTSSGFNGQTGGNYGGGAGGGAATLNGTTSGPGAVGANGIVIVITGF